MGKKIVPSPLPSLLSFWFPTPTPTFPHNVSFVGKMLLTAKLTFFMEKLNFTLLKENDFNYVTSSWKEGDKKREGVVVAKEWHRFQGNWPQYSKKKKKTPIGRRQAEQFPPPTWRQQYSGLNREDSPWGSALSNCLRLRDPPQEV